jgi:hypothetical protein
LNPPEALRCDCGYNFTDGAVEESFRHSAQRGRWHVGWFFIQWAICSCIGIVALFVFLELDRHLDFQIGLAGQMALWPANFLLGIAYVDGTSRAFQIASQMAFFLNLAYYGFVFLIIWRLSMLLLRRTISKATASTNKPQP